MRKTILIGITALILTLAGGFFYRQKFQVRDVVFEYQKTSLSETALHKNTDVVDPLYLPQGINLAVPFTSQAPHANWDLPYKETCEEASLLMVARYKNGEPIVSAEDADQEILKLVEFQNDYFGDPAKLGQSHAERGDYKDTTAEQTAEIARTYYGFKNTEVMYDFTIDNIKAALSGGHPVMVPAAGRKLGNPYFRRPGPLYHMLVIRGYTKDKFITNDPGTKRGEGFVYDHDVLMNAVHDWNGGEVESGQKVMIVMR